MKNLIWYLAISVFLLDRFSKFIVLRNLDYNSSIEIIKNFFYLTLVHNTGIAFGIFKDQTLFFVIVSISAIITIVLYNIRKKYKPSLLQELGFGLILGGALGNLVDRLHFGYVVDFFDFKIWPVFNVADSAITIGASLLLISIFKIKKQK